MLNRSPPLSHGHVPPDFFIQICVSLPDRRSNHACLVEQSGGRELRSLLIEDSHVNRVRLVSFASVSHTRVHTQAHRYTHTRVHTQL